MASPASERGRLPGLVGVAAALFAVEFVWLAWAPLDRQTWALENLLAVPLALMLLFGRSRLGLSDVSLLLLLLFLGLHEVGSHFTYSRVPTPSWFDTLFQGRNHYDRLVHLAFGLLVLRPIAELLRRALPRPSRRLLLVLSVCVILSLSSAYELLEWLAAVVVDPGTGIAFVGAQGDVWDAQKDTGLALVGAVVSASILGRSRVDLLAPDREARQGRNGA